MKERTVKMPCGAEVEYEGSIGDHDGGYWYILCGGTRGKCNSSLKKKCPIYDPDVIGADKRGFI